MKKLIANLLRWYFLLVPPPEEECKHGYGVKVCPDCRHAALEAAGDKRSNTLPELRLPGPSYS